MQEGIFYGLCEYLEVPLFIINIERTGSFTFGYLNPAFEKATGFCREDAVGREFPEIPGFSREDSATLRDRCQRCLSEGTPVGYGEDAPPLAMGRQSFHAVFVPMSDSSGKTSHIAGIIDPDAARRKAEKELRQSHDLLRAVIEAVPTAIIGLDLDGNVHSVWNAAAEKMLGWSAQEVMGRPLPSVPTERQGEFEGFRERIRKGLTLNGVEVRRQRRDGTPIDYSIYASPLHDADGRISGNIAVLVDIGERNRAKQALEASEAKLRGILENIGIGVVLINPKMEICEVNRQMREWFPTVDLSQCPLCYKVFHDPPREDVCEFCPAQKTLQNGLVHEVMTKTQRGNSLRSYRLVAFPVFNAAKEVTAVIEMVEDITEREQADQEKEKLQAQLAQAQKMESVGRLAGGVAHDFNNMLSVIIGYAELTLMNIAPEDPLYVQLQEVEAAARRSAALTRQLLAFARKQTVSPRVLDLNDTIFSMLKMLERLIGENIELIWSPAADLWPVKIDPSQIDQVLTNLCLNARDAISDVGKLIIATGNCSFDDAYCAGHKGLVPGDYTLISITDNGRGMDEETLSHIFEPFFSTKDQARNTGLGLATVYGIVKQNNGYIDVCSKPGEGTAFQVYFPREKDRRVEAGGLAQADILIRGTETILILDDEESILNLCASILKKLGYVTLTARSPREAIGLFEKHSEEIQLLLTDVVLPEMSGRDVAEKLVSMKPGLKCLYMSGYTANIIAPRGVLGKGVRLIQKPLTVKDLGVAVRQALDQATSGGAI